MSLLRAAVATAALLAAAGASANNGDADPTFGTGGVVIVSYDLPNTNFEEFGTRVLVQPQGYVLVGTVSVGTNAAPEYDLVVTRVDRTGTLDPTFGTNSGRTMFSATGKFDFVGGASIAPDGSLLIAVHGAVGGDPGAVIKLTADGIPASFGAGGVIVVPEFYAADVIGLADGGVLASGLYNFSSLSVLRLDANGNPVTAFGNQSPTNGWAITGGDGAGGLLVQADGKIILGGSSGYGYPYDDDFYVVRFSDMGVRDNTFNNNTGEVRIGFDRCGSTPSSGFQNRDFITGLAAQPDGDILVVGTANGYCDAGNLGSAIGAARLHPDGTPDTAFGTPLFQFAAGSDTQATGIAMQGGKLFIGATAAGGFATASDFGVIRLNYSGTADVTWGNAGYTHYDLGGAHDDSAAGIALDGSSPIIVGTRNLTYPDTDIGALRVANDSIFGDGFD